MKPNVIPRTFPIAGALIIFFSDLAPAASSASDRIDELIAADWVRHSAIPGDIVSDEVFVRRVYLDVNGRIPSAAEIRDFQNDSPDARRALLIDRLLESEGYVNHMFTFWADILRINSVHSSGRYGARAYADWVRDSLRKNAPYDEFVRDLVAGEGGIHTNGAAGYYVRDRGMPLDNLANTVRIFLGTRLECAQCHDHPFDTWTQSDFYGMAAFSHGMTADLERGRSRTITEATAAIKTDELLDAATKRARSAAILLIAAKLEDNVRVRHDSEAILKLPHDYQYDDAKPGDVVEPVAMFGNFPRVGSPGEKMVRYAEWLTSPENPRFTKVIVNRLWKELMGEGLIAGIDNLTDASESAHPELLDFLEREMIRLDYDIKPFLRMILNSKVYQRESYSGEIGSTAPHVFTGPLMRRLGAEQIWDSIVTLVNPDPEHGNWKRGEEDFLRTYWPEMLSETIRDRSATQLTEMAADIVAVQEGHAARMVDAKERKKAADKVRDKEASLAIGAEIKTLQYSLPDEIYREVFGPMLAEAGLGRKPGALPEGTGDYLALADPKKVAYDSTGRVPRLRALATAETAVYESEMDALGFTENSIRKSYPPYAKSVRTTYIRAAHLPAPAPPGHFLRLLGQSDRETIENVESVSSVPQTLTLLNGPIYEKVCHPFSIVSRDLEKADDDEARIDSIYLSMLGRSSTAGEKVIILTNIQKRPDLWREDLIFALLNSREFTYQR